MNRVEKQYSFYRSTAQRSQYFHYVFKLCKFQPPLVQACFHGDAAEVRNLISRKEDVNLQVNQKFLLIFLATFLLFEVMHLERNVLG